MSSPRSSTPPPRSPPPLSSAPASFLCFSKSGCCQNSPSWPVFFPSGPHLDLPPAPPHLISILFQTVPFVSLSLLPGFYPFIRLIPSSWRSTNFPYADSPLLPLPTCYSVSIPLTTVLFFISLRPAAAPAVVPHYPFFRVPFHPHPSSFALLVSAALLFFRNFVDFLFPSPLPPSLLPSSRPFFGVTDFSVSFLLFLYSYAFQGRQWCLSFCTSHQSFIPAFLPCSAPSFHSNFSYVI